MSKDTQQELLMHTFSLIIGDHRASALSAALLERFGTLSALVESMPLPEHASSAPESVRSLLAFIPHLHRIRSLEKMGDHPRLHSLPRTQQYISALYTGIQYEQLYLLCLDKNLHLIECCRINQGSLKEVAFYPRRLLQEALTRRADAIILCHNHPGNWPFFSEFDVSSTCELLNLCVQNKIALLDHLLIAGEQISSMRRRTYIPEKQWRAAGEIVPPLPRWLSSAES